MQTNKKLDESKVIPMTSLISKAQGEPYTNFPQDESVLLYPNIYIEGDYILSYDSKKQEITIVAPKVIVNKVLKNIDTKAVFLELIYSFKGEEKHLIIPRKHLSKYHLIQYQEQGFPVYEHNATNLIKHLVNQEQIAPIGLVHSQIGWSTYKDTLTFKAYKCVGIDSKYVGKLSIKPKGKYKKWLKLIKQYVIGHIPLEVALVCGLSSMIVGLIGKTIGADTLFIHICGESSQGKTTATRLALSAFCFPDVRENGLFTTWDFTDNGMGGQLSDNYGLAIAFDEVSMSKQNDFTRAIYKIAAGKDKARMQKDLTMVKPSSWATTAISTGEFSLSSKTNQNTGLKMRLLEFSNVTWTKDAKSADEIKEIVLENHGHGALKLAEHLAQIGKEAVIQKWREYKDLCFERIIQKDHFSNRISAKLAIIMVTAEFVEKALEIELHKESILEFLIENENRSTETRDIGENAYDYFCQQFTINRRHFHNSYNNSHFEAAENLERWGIISHNKNGVFEVAIVKSIFERLMKQGGFEDVNVILKNWKQKEYLDYEKGRNTRKRKLFGGPEVHVYVILIKQDDSFEDACKKTGKTTTNSQCKTR
jgi:hypothetical protein